MANRLGRVPIAPKVNTLEAEIGRDQHLLTGRNSEQSTIVADAKRDKLFSGFGRGPADACNQRFFGERQECKYRSTGGYVPTVYTVLLKRDSESVSELDLGATSVFVGSSIERSGFVCRP